jgi:hypothetical protein
MELNNNEINALKGILDAASKYVGITDGGVIVSNVAHFVKKIAEYEQKEEVDSKD